MTALLQILILCLMAPLALADANGDALGTSEFVSLPNSAFSYVSIRGEAAAQIYQNLRIKAEPVAQEQGYAQDASMKSVAALTCLNSPSTARVNVCTFTVPEAPGTAYQSILGQSAVMTDQYVDQTYLRILGKSAHALFGALNLEAEDVKDEGVATGVKVKRNEWVVCSSDDDCSFKLNNATGAPVR